MRSITHDNVRRAIRSLPSLAHYEVKAISSQQEVPSGTQFAVSIQSKLDGHLAVLDGTRTGTYWRFAYVPFSYESAVEALTLEPCFGFWGEQTSQFVGLAEDLKNGAI